MLSFPRAILELCITYQLQIFRQAKGLEFYVKRSVLQREEKHQTLHKSDDIVSESRR